MTATVIAVEGVSCTGKSTLAALLAARADTVVVPCYFHAAIGPRERPPWSSSSAATQLDAVRVLLQVEARRAAQTAAAVADGRTVILDRSVDTVLAHAHAVGAIEGFDCDQAARTLVTAAIIAIPQVTALLQAPYPVLASRAARRAGMPAMLYSRRFTDGFREHFATSPVTARVVWLDATRPPQVLADEVGQLLQLTGGPS